MTTSAPAETARSAAAGDPTWTSTVVPASRRRAIAVASIPHDSDTAGTSSSTRRSRRSLWSNARTRFTQYSPLTDLAISRTCSRKTGGGVHAAAKHPRPPAAQTAATRRGVVAGPIGACITTGTPFATKPTYWRPGPSESRCATDAAQADLAHGQRRSRRDADPVRRDRRPFIARRRQRGGSSVRRRRGIVDLDGAGQVA